MERDGNGNGNQSRVLRNEVLLLNDQNSLASPSIPGKLTSTTMPHSAKPPECTQLPFHADCRLHKELKDFYEWISPTSKEHDVRAYVVKRVVDAIESALPHCRAYP